MSLLQFNAEIECYEGNCNGFRNHIITFLKLDAKFGIVFFDYHCTKCKSSHTGYVSIEVWKKIVPQRVEELN